MKKIHAILLGFCAIACANTSFAGHKDPGFYADLGAGYGKANVKGSGVHNRGFMGTANLGYQFTPHLALEGGASMYRKTLTVRNYNTHLAAKGILSINDQVDAFGKLGVAYVHGIGTNAKANNRFAPYLGAGLTYWVNENLGATLQGEGTPKRGNSVPSMFGATLGLTYKFN